MANQGTQLLNPIMKNVVEGVSGPINVNCDLHASEATCNGVCYSYRYQGNSGLEYLNWGSGGTYMCACKIG